MNDTLSCCRIEVNENLLLHASNYLEDQQSILEKRAKLFALLGNEVRLKIVQLFLCYEKLCVCDLSDILKMKQSPVSQHLRKLKDGGILVSKRDGMTIFYSIEPSLREQLKTIIEG